MNESLLYEILNYNEIHYDYSSLFYDKCLKEKIKNTYRLQTIDRFLDMIDEHFSILFYMHIVDGPPSKNIINNIFSAMDYQERFRPPNYYGLPTYMYTFKKFDNKIIKYKRRRKKRFMNKRYSRVVNSLLLLK